MAEWWEGVTLSWLGQPGHGCDHGLPAAMVFKPVVTRNAIQYERQALQPLTRR